MTHNKKDVVVTGAEYNQFRDYLEGLSGILLGDGKEYLVVSRLRKLMAERELPNLTELMLSLIHI